MSIAPQAGRPGRARLVAAAAGALALGVAVYLVDRPAGSAQLVPAAWHAAQPLGVFGFFGSVIPDFVHAFALSILTGLLARTRRGAAAACFAWWFVDSVLEAGQARLAAEALGPHLPAFLSTYLLAGTFDVADLAAIALGAGLAYTLLAADSRTSRRAAAATGLALTVSGLVLALGSGGGSTASTSAPAVPDACAGQIYIDTPTYQDLWQTDRTTVDVGGGVPTPGGPYRRDCTGFDPGYVITWRNEANGASGRAAAWSRFSGSLLNLCVTGWFAYGIPLAPGDNRITVSGGDLGGDCFTVRRLPDTTAPSVLSVSPADRAFDVPTNTSVSVSFSEDIDGASVTPSTFVLLAPNGVAVAGTLRLDSRTTLRFTPAAPLASLGPTDPGAYTARVTTGVRDSAGQNPLAADYVWTFRTGTAADATPPTVTSMEPAADSDCAGTESAVQARFSESVQASTVNTSTFFVEDDRNVRVPATVAPLSNLARLQPASPLAVGSRYTATLSTGIHDLAGNALAADVRWSFTTGLEYGHWARTTVAGAPAARAWHAAVWTGAEMVVAGGVTFGTDAGGRYEPSTDRWTPIAPPPLQLSSVDQVTAWTGTEMIVYGGTVPVLAYDPRVDAWRVASGTGAPVGKSGYSAVWSGSELIVWGGVNASGARVMSGARYNPSTDTWQATALDGAPAARQQHSAVWTGREMIVWGGVLDSGAVTSTGARYDPSTDTWTPLPTAGAPTPRFGHTAVWAGEAMTVWGSVAGGGRYFPATDAWQPMTSHCAPPVRNAHRAVTDGRRMIVWGGASAGYTQAYAHGALYDPVADSWQAITGVDAPTRRYGHSLVWTGTRAIVWGGSDGGPLDTGGQYAP